ncbi:MAG TPA: cytochrome c-type biogenesis protein CcmH [Candidatus Binataceae bacterium]|nr:cytochrome c-type biogenesis protein CcmH [Candidatus Binataceae bacterium]
MKLAHRWSIRIAAYAAMLTLVAALPLLAATTVDEVSQGLTCQCGCGLTVANCNHPECNFSVPMRGDIARMIDKGMGRTQIIAFYRAKYGEKILSAPTTEGFNLLAWVMPFAAVLIGGGFVVLMLGRWRRATPSLPSGPEAVAQRIPLIDPKLREQLDDQVREQL